MRDKREQVNRAVLNLIRAGNPQDEVFVVNIGQNAYLDQDYTSDVSLLEKALQTLADATGGSAFSPESLDRVSEITRTLAHDIRSQYTTAYKPQNENTTVTYHPIVVEARAPGYGRLTVRTRSGYYTGESVR